MTQNFDIRRENVARQDWGPTQILGVGGAAVVLALFPLFTNSDFIVIPRVTRRIGLSWQYNFLGGNGPQGGARLQFVWRRSPIAGGVFPQSEEFLEPIVDLTSLTEAAPFAQTPSFLYELDLPIFSGAPGEGQGYISLERPPGMQELRVRAAEAVAGDPGSMWILASAAADL